jgi:integrase
LPSAPALAMSLVRVDGRAPADPLFSGIRGHGWSRNRVFRRDAFDAAASGVGLEGLTPHEMRHTAASLAISMRATIQAVQRMLGHSSAAVTRDTYADLFDTGLDSDVGALGAAVVGKEWAGPRKARRPKMVQPTSIV